MIALISGWRARTRERERKKERKTVSLFIPVTVQQLDFFQSILTTYVPESALTCHAWYTTWRALPACGETYRRFVISISYFPPADSILLRCYVTIVKLAATAKTSSCSAPRAISVLFESPSKASWGGDLRHLCESASVVEQNALWQKQYVKHDRLVKKLGMQQSPGDPYQKYLRWCEVILFHFHR